MDVVELVESNTKLVYHQLNRFDLQNEPDAESLAFEALFRAAQTYSGQYAFSTYAVCCISNELRKYLRSLKSSRKLNTLSYDAPLSDSDDSDSFEYLLGSVDNSESNLLQQEHYQQTLAAIESAICALSNPTQQNIIRIWQQSDYQMKQADLAKAAKISQPVVSRALSRFRYILTQELEELT